MNDLGTRLRESLRGVDPPRQDLNRVRRRAAGHRARRLVGAGLAAAVVAAGLVVPLMLLARIGEQPRVPATPSVEGFGLRMDVPDGWDRRIFWTTADLGPVIQAATFPLPPAGSDFNRTAVVGMGEGDVLLTLHEYVTVCPCTRFDPVELPLTVVEDDRKHLPWLEDGHRYLQRAFLHGDRWFIAGVEFGSDPPPAELRRQVDEALASLEVDPGEPAGPSSDPPGGVYAAPSFPAAPGWSTVARPGRIEANEASMAWASTVPLLAEDLSFWAESDTLGFLPVETVRSLPPDGVVIVAWADPAGDRYAAAPQRELPLLVSDADVRLTWEGQVAENVPEYVLWQRVNGWFLDVRLLFGTLHPSEETLALAQEQLSRLVLPPAPAGSDGSGAHREDADRYEVVLPAGWQLHEDPTPLLVDPRILFAAGTGDVPAGGDCAPKEAMAVLASDGALLWVHERDAPENPYEFPVRPEPLDLGPLLGPFDCIGERTHLVRFRDGNRYFQAHVMFGPDATGTTRDEAEAALDSFVPDPAREAPFGAGCHTTGPWIECPEAAWVLQVLNEAGFVHLGDTGSAIEAEGRGAHFDIWATDADAGRPEVVPLEEEIENGVYNPLTTLHGVTVYVEGPGDDGVVRRIVWEAQGFHVWVSGAGLPGELPGVPDQAALAELVLQSLEVPFVDDV
jgi:hypothetical protein